MNRRGFLAALGLAPVLAKLGLAREAPKPAPAAWPPASAFPPPPMRTEYFEPYSIPCFINEHTAFGGGGSWTFPKIQPRPQRVRRTSRFTDSHIRWRWKLQDRARRVAARTLKVS